MISVAECVPTFNDWERMKQGLKRLEPATPPSRRIGIDAMRAGINSRLFFWYVVKDKDEILADIVTEVTQENDKRIFNIQSLFGRDMKRWLNEVEPFFEHAAKVNRCDVFRLCAQHAQARLYDKFFPEHTHFHIFERGVSYERTTA